MVTRFCASNTDMTCMMTRVASMPMARRRQKTASMTSPPAKDQRQQLAARAKHVVLAELFEQASALEQTAAYVAEQCAIDPMIIVTVTSSSVLRSRSCRWR